MKQVKQKRNPPATLHRISPVRISAELRDPRLKEHSELSPDSSAEIGTDYFSWCSSAGLAPTPDGWGLLHGTFLSKRGRRARVTFATDDLTFHRTFVAASEMRPSMGIQADPRRYPFTRNGWPGPARQGGSWVDTPVSPWRPTFREASPTVNTKNHVHGLQLLNGRAREVCVVFCRSRSGDRWIILDVHPAESQTMIILESGDEFFMPPRTAVIPGWNLKSVPPPCMEPGCMQVPETFL